MCSSAPDTSGINRAAEANATVAQEALDWYKQQYADSAGDRSAASSRAAAVSDAQLAAMQEATREAQSASDFQDRNLRPLQQSLVDEANNYDTEGKREELAGKAIADVSEAAGAARAAESRQMARMGINPSDGAYAAEATQRGNATLLAQSGAANKARQDATVYGHALRTDAAAALSGLPANAATQAGLALNSGNASVGNAQVPWTVAQQGANLGGAGYSTAINGNSSAGNLYGTIANIQNTADANSNSIFGAIGQGVGMWAGGGFRMPSDKNIKEDVKPTTDEEALDAVNATPVKNWKYKAGSVADDGGQEHTGPMAQDVQKTMGSKVAPRGRVIDLISANGINMKAIQATNKKIDKLAAAMGVTV